MAATCDYNCADLPEHEVANCGQYKKGGINAFAYLECDHTITDFSNATQWQTNITSGKAKIFRNIRGSFPEGSPVQGENPNGCGAQTITDSYDRTFEFKDYNVSAANDALYDEMNAGRNGFLVSYNCTEEEIQIVEYSTTWNVRDIVPENNREKQHYPGTVSWTALPRPTRMEAPAGIFA